MTRLPIIQHNQRRRLSTLSVTTALAGALLLSPTALAQEDGSAPKWSGWLEMGGKIGTERSLGQFDIYAPAWQDERSLALINLRMVGDNHSSMEGNLGVIYRRMLDSGWNLGGYGYLDVRRSEHDNTFHQATLGVEALGPDFDFRANAYIPFGAQWQDAPSESELEVQGGELQLLAGEERALYGVDAEVGARVPVFEREGPLDLRVYAGGYHFDGADAESVTGPRGRVELDIFELPGLSPNARVTASAEAQWDEPRGSQGFLGLSLSIPLQGDMGGSDARPLTRQERRMMAPVVRDVDIVTEAGPSQRPETTEDVENVATGVTIGEVVEVAGGGGNLADALAAAEENGLVVAKGGDGDLDGGVELEDGQTLIGGGHNLAVRGVDSGQTMTYTAPGSRGTVIINGGEAPVVELANNTYVGGLSIQGDSSMGRDSALVGAPENTENLHIIRNDISRTGGYGAGFMKNSSDITLHENRISNTENGNIAFGEDVSNVELTRNHVSGTQGSGVGFLDGASDIRLSGNKIMDAGEHGIHFEGRSENITLTGNRVSETGRNGVYFEGSASNVTLASNDISRTGVPFDGNVDGSGLAFVDGANDIKVKRNTISETSGDGIFFTDGESISDIQLSGNSLADIDGDGIDMNADDISNVTISDNILSDIGSTGIFSYGQVTKLTVEGNLISGQEGSNSGISIYEGGSEMRLTGNSISDFDSSGMFLTGDEYEDLMVDDNSISGTGSDGIFFTSSLKDTTVKNNSIFNAEGSGISLVTGADGLVLEGNLISAIDESGIYLTGIDHDAQIDSNRFEGKIGTDLFWLGSGHYIGTDNVDATEELGGDVCADIAGTYTGPGFTIETSGGTETCGDSY